MRKERKNNHYKIYKGNKYRIYRNPTFIEKYNLPKDLVLIEDNYMQEFRSGMRLYFNISIRRYIIYKTIPDIYIKEQHARQAFKEIKNKLVCVCIVDGKNKEYREPGEWLFWLFRNQDITKTGTKDLNKAVEDFVKSVDQDEEDTEKKLRIKAQDLQYELNKDMKALLTGRASYLIGGPIRKQHQEKKTKVYGYSPRTGKVYKLERKKK